MKGVGSNLFLERETYRRRRLEDAAKVLLVLAIILIMLPILWSDVARTAGGGTYLFSVWGLLIVLGAVISRKLSERAPENPQTDDNAEPSGKS